MLWDQLLGTYYRRPGHAVERIGIADYMPPGFLDQLALPFRWRRVQAAPAGADEAA
jgi:hypothetical protein